MASTNKTPHYDLPQFIGTDKPSWLGDVNGAMLAIDTALYSVKTDSQDAATSAISAQAAAQSAASSAEQAATGVTELTTEVAKLKTDLSATQTQVTTSANAITQLQSQVAVIEPKVTQLQTDVQQAQTTASAASTAASTAQTTANNANTLAQKLNTWAIAYQDFLGNYHADGSPRVSCSNLCLTSDSWGFHLAGVITNPASTTLTVNIEFYNVTQNMVDTVSQLNVFGRVLDTSSAGSTLKSISSISGQFNGTGKNKTLAVTLTLNAGAGGAQHYLSVGIDIGIPDSWHATPPTLN